MGNDNVNVVLTKETVSVDGDSPASYRLNSYYQEKLLKHGTLPISELIAYGYEIFQNLFSTDKRKEYIADKLKLGDSDCLSITIKSDSTDIHNIPFEIMNNDRTETGFLLKKGNVSVVRDMPMLNKKIIPAAPPIRILILISMPLETYANNPIDPLKELKVIYEALEEHIARGLVEIDVEEKVNIPVVKARLLKGHYHIVHFTGHGSEGGYLVIEDDGYHERQKLMKADELKKLFEGSNVSLFYFDACETAKASPYVPSLAQNIFSGIPSSYVIANLASVRDDLATESAKFIYKRLFTGESIGHVLNEVRVKLTTDWWKPVIYGEAYKKIFILEKFEQRVKIKKVIYRPPRTIKNYVYRYGIVRHASGMIEDGQRYLVLHGIGGAGKSTLAIYLSEFFEAKFRHIVFMDLRKEKIASPEELIKTVLREFAFEGFITEKECEGLHPVKQWKLLNEKIDSRWLLIIDNLEIIQDERGIIINRFERLISEVLNTAKVFTIFTTRLQPLLAPRQPLENMLEIGEYSEGEVRFLFRDLKEEEKRFFAENYQAIRYFFGNHPLSLSRAIEKKNMTLNNIFNSEDLRETLDFYRSYFDKNRQSMEKLFCLEYPFSKTLLNSLFPAAFISLLTESLLVLQCHEDHYAPYRVIHSYYQDEYPLPDFAPFKNELLKFLSPFITAEGKEFALSSPDILNIASILMEYRKRTGSKDIDDTLLLIFNILARREDTKIILPDNILGTMEEIADGLKAPDEATFVSYNNLAGVYRAKGDYDLAIVFFEKALKIAEAKAGKDHPDTATTYNNLALVYQAKSEYDRAIAFFEKALKIREEKLGKDHPSTATTYNNLAMVYQAKGEYDRAIEFYEKAMKIKEDKLGKDHPDTVNMYNNLATVYSAKGEYDRAIAFFEKARKIREETLGKNHPDTACTYNNLAGVYKAKCEYDQAIVFYEKARKIAEERLGKDHPYTAATYNNLAMVHLAKGEYDQAVAFFVKAMKIAEEKLGKDHPDTANTYNNLAMVYQDKGEYDRAIEFYEKAMKIKEEKLGKDHPDTANTYSNLAGIYQANGDYDRAIGFFEKALKIKEEKLGKDHPDTATAYNNLAGVYRAQGDYDQAIELFEKGLKIAEEKLGRDHPNTATIYKNLALVYQAQGEYTWAREFCEKALAIYKTRKDYRDYRDQLIILPLLIDVISKKAPIDYPVLSIHLDEFLRLYDIFADQRDSIIRGIIHYFVQHKIFDRLDLPKLQASITDNPSLQRLERFLRLLSTT